MAASSSRMSHRGLPSLKEIVQKLSTRASNNLENGLREVQSLVRKSKGLEIVREFRELGGLDEVVEVVKSGSDEKLTDLALSVLATCCREHETKSRVHELDGVSAVVEVLKAQSSVSIINRASRTLANLAEAPKLSAAIHRKDVIPLLVKYLKETTDSNCRQSILRTVRILADTNQHTWEILQSEGLLVVLSCLDSEDVKLVSCAAHTSAELTTNLGSGQSTEALRSYREAGRQAVEDNGVELLVSLLSHSQSSIQEHALMALLNLMVSEGVRVSAGKAGGVEVFIERGKATTFAGWATYIHCLCFCCREAVNRVRVRDLEGLQVLLNILKTSNEDCLRLHETVLVALMDFYYDEQSLNYLAACGFIQVLVSQLRQEEMHTVIGSADSSNSKSEYDELREPGLVINKPSTSSSKTTADTSLTNTLLSGPRKRARSQSGSASTKQLHKAEHSVGKQVHIKGPAYESPELSAVLLYPSRAKRTKLSNQPLPQDTLRQEIPISSPVVTSNVPAEVAQGVANKVQHECSSPSHSLNVSGMSPEAHPPDYHSYLNLETTPYSLPKTDWEWFLQHREQTGQDLSPRSFSSFSSPLSLSPPRYDFSPLSSPNWSPQWSPQHSPQHSPRWSSPQYNTEWSSEQAPQWSPQHSPQWGHQPLPDESDSPSSPSQESDSTVTEYSTQMTVSGLSSSAVPVASIATLTTKFDVPDAVIMDGLLSDTSSRSLSEGMLSADSLSRKPISTVKTGEAAIAMGSTMPAVCNLSLDDSRECSSSRESVESQQLGRTIYSDCSPSKIQDRQLASLSCPLHDRQSTSSIEVRQKAAIFREPSTKSLKMRTGKNKTTSVSRQTPKGTCLEVIESDTDLLPFIASSEPKDKSVTSKFERDMEIRRAKEEGKLRRREYAVVTLLSRYSHMDDPSTNMAKESVISVLLDYQPNSAYLQSKCQRTLHRILRNRLCFEQLILEHVPLLIARKMLEREHRAKPVRSVDTRKQEGNKDETTGKGSQTTASARSLKSRTMPSNSVKCSAEDNSQLMRGPKRPMARNRSNSFSTEPATTSTEATFSATGQRKRAQSSDADTVADLIDDSASDTTSVCSMDTLESEQFQLWGDTASPLYPLMVSTCQYRQSLMLGLLVSDSAKGKMACILAVPYICQSNSLKRKLLIKHKGLQILLDYLRKGNIDTDVFRKAVQCLCDIFTSLPLDTNVPFSESIHRTRFLRIFGDRTCLHKSVVIGKRVSHTDTRSNVRSEQEKCVINPGVDGNELLSAHQDASTTIEGSSSKLSGSFLYQDAGTSHTVDSIGQSDQLERAVAGSIQMALGEAMDCSACSSADISTSKHSSSEFQDHRRIPHMAFQQRNSAKSCACRYDAIEQQPDVSFLLDQKAVIHAHRDILIKSSEYFACLLEGPYLESGQNMVPIKQISKESLVMILHTLYGCLHTQCCHMRDALASGCKAVLDSIACSGRFLLWPVQNHLCDIIVDDYMDASTVVNHFQFGLKHSCSKLSSACLMYMLTSGQVSAKHFQDLVERGCAEDAFKTIQRMITDALFSMS